MQKEMTALVEKFGDNRFKIRQQAYERLVEIVEEDEKMVFLPFLKDAVRYKDSETTRRIKGAMDYYYVFKPDNYSLIPWIDMLPEDFPDRKNVIIKYLKKSPPLFGDGWDYPDYRWATTLLICDLLDNGTARHEAINLLNAMAEKEKRHKGGHNWK
ncbi:MAG: hypothetical protein HYT36_01715 [Candidatus Staskawiczbacteria bacterium]|nr:hypothetical protein [Candidatus Staskawiczbacteria bacterium]